MNYLITGGAGFIGSACCRRLLQDKRNKIVNVDCLYPCSTANSDVTTTHDNFVFIGENIKNTAAILTALQTYNIDVIIHFAAQSHVDTSFTNPMLYSQDNILGTHSLLEASRQYGKLRRFIHISTDEVYGENKRSDTSAKTEESLLQPTNPYAASKAAAEMLTHAYRESYGLPVIIVRSNNIYGPGQYPEKVVPRFVLQLLENKPVTIAGSGEQLRSFLYVEDAVDAVLTITDKGTIGEVYNISSKAELSILKLAHLLIDILHPDNPNPNDFIRFGPDRNFNDQRYWIESTKLANLGWTQNTAFEDGIRKTIDWFKNVDVNTYWQKSFGDNGKPVVYFVGARGWIGQQFSRQLCERGWIVHAATARADNHAEIIKEINKLHPKPTHIVSMIGRTHGPGFSTIDYLEQTGKLVENINDNLYAPLVLAEVARQINLHYLYLGTGCIFEYDEQHPRGNEHTGFTENDRPNFFGSSYSVVKGFTDRLLAVHPQTLNVRIRMPISLQDSPRNFITKIINYKKSVAFLIL